MSKKQMSTHKKRFIKEKLLTLGKDLKCAYCLKQLDKATLTLDHIDPLFKGGTHRVDNLTPACYSCNHRKGAKNRKPKFTAMDLGVLNTQIMNDYHHNLYLKRNNMCKRIKKYFIGAIQRIVE